MPPESESVLDIRGLSKSYRIGHIIQKKRKALQDLNLQVYQGEVLGFLGPNGSGKTTTLKILMGLLKPDAGEVFVLGEALPQRGWRYRVGFLPEHPYFYDYLTPREYLHYVGRLFALPNDVRHSRIASLLDRVGLARSADVTLRRFSKGMLQRLGLAQALINDPELVILDEPMSGLDPIGRRLVRDLILDLRRAGKTVFFSTHILGDAETLCDRVAVLDRGVLVDTGPLDRILKLDVSHLEVLVQAVDASDLRLDGLRRTERLGDRWRLEIEEGALGRVVHWVESAKGRILGVQPIRQSLEDYFLREVGREQRGGEWLDRD
jgi:ABC-2 type transport system ATP-binding protein